MAPEILEREGLRLQDRMMIPGGLRDIKAHLKGRSWDIPLTKTVLSKSMLFTGGTGTGKTTALNGVVSELIGSLGPDDCMIVFDAKGDFRRQFCRDGIDVVLSGDEHATAYWNMFREVEVDGPDKLDANIREIANSFFDEKIRRSNAPFFPMAARDTLAAIITYINRTLVSNEQDHLELYQFLRDASLEDIVTCLSLHPDLMGVLDYIDASRGSPEQSQGVLSELRIVCNELLNNQFRQRGDFSVRDFIRNGSGRILFLEYDLSVGSVMGPVYKTIFDLAIKETLGRREGGPSSRGAGYRPWGNVYFVADEFSLLRGLYHIQTGVNYARSLNSSYLIACQNCQQLFDIYGQEIARSIMSAFGTLVSFRTTDRATIEFIQDHSGSAREILAYRGADYTKGRTTSLITRKVVEDWDILKLGVGEAIVSVPDYDPNPVRFRVKDWT